jgi:hypothetical protein
MLKLCLWNEQITHPRRRHRVRRVDPAARLMTHAEQKARASVAERRGAPKQVRGGRVVAIHAGRIISIIIVTAVIMRTVTSARTIFVVLLLINASIHSAAVNATVSGPPPRHTALQFESERHQCAHAFSDWQTVANAVEIGAGATQRAADGDAHTRTATARANSKAKAAAERVQCTTAAGAGAATAAAGIVDIVIAVIATDATNGAAKQSERAATI